jgi:thiol-disulfide isomerase/thioredoxin
MLKNFYIIICIIIIIGIYYYSNFKSESFDESNNKSKVKVYNYYTSWCGWSQKFLPEWKIFSDKVNESKNIQAISVACDDPENNNACLNVPGFPYIMIEKDNSTIPYEGERKADKILDFVNNMIKF